MKFIGYVIVDAEGKIIKRFTNKENLEDVVHYIVINETDFSTEQIKQLYLCENKEKLVNI
jgi:hypothetical protein